MPDQDYYTLLTDAGRAALAAAMADDSPLGIAEAALGDGGGASYDPTPDQTALVGEWHRRPVNRITVDPANPHWVVVEVVVPMSVGGHYVREVGLIDSDGALIAIAKFPPTYKPTLIAGTGSDLVIRVILEVANADSVELLIDPTVVTASRAYVDQTVGAIAGDLTQANAAIRDEIEQSIADLHAAREAQAAAGFGQPTEVVTFVSSDGSWSPPGGTRAIRWRLVAGGGGGGGAVYGAVRPAVGGNGGSYGEWLDTAIAASYAVVIGDGGTGGSGLSHSHGSQGGETSVTPGSGSSRSVTGGGGATTPSGGSPPIVNRPSLLRPSAGSNLDVGVVGGLSSVAIASTDTEGVSGSGGDSMLGRGARGKLVSEAATHGDAAAANSGGGGGGAVASGAAGRNGGNGGSGIVIAEIFK